MMVYGLELYGELRHDRASTEGQVNRRRRELLAAATPGTGVDAHVVFAKSDRGEVGLPGPS